MKSVAICITSVSPVTMFDISVKLRVFHQIITTLYAHTILKRQIPLNKQKNAHKTLLKIACQGKTK